MNYLRLEGMDAVSVFDICQAYQQLEHDYNRGGWLQERPSNQRRRESIGVQLLRMQYRDAYRWVDICAPYNEADDPGDDDVRHIYLANVLKWGLPIDEQMMARIKTYFVEDFWRSFPQCAGNSYLQGA